MMSPALRTAGVLVQRRRCIPGISGLMNDGS
jgi:hypothetical protein